MAAYLNLALTNNAQYLVQIPSEGLALGIVAGMYASTAPIELTSGVSPGSYRAFVNPSHIVTTSVFADVPDPARMMVWMRAHAS